MSLNFVQLNAEFLCQKHSLTHIFIPKHAKSACGQKNVFLSRQCWNNACYERGSHRSRLEIAMGTVRRDVRSSAACAKPGGQLTQHLPCCVCAR